MGLRTKTCPDCGDDLFVREGLGGTLWECPAHGLRAWYFEQGSTPGGILRH